MELGKKLLDVAKAMIPGVTSSEAETEAATKDTEKESKILASQPDTAEETKSKIKSSDIPESAERIESEKKESSEIHTKISKPQGEESKEPEQSQNPPSVTSVATEEAQISTKPEIQESDVIKISEAKEPEAEKSEESKPIETGILEGVNKEELLKKMDDSLARKIQSFVDKYPESDIAHTNLKAEVMAAAAKNEGVEQTGKSSIEAQSKIKQEDLLKGTIDPRKEREFLEHMDKATARTIQSFVDKYPDSEVARSGLKEKAAKSVS